jgi:protocatechuate 3,4-dioxygenase, alpha subunit
MADLTPSQTVGPFLHLALDDPALATPVAADDPDAVTVHGTVVDGDGAPVPDAVVETWQFGGPFARCTTDADGGWSIRTRRPPGVATLDGTAQAPHLALSVFARGLLDRVVTRVYFDGDPANDADPVLATLGGRADRLLAHQHGDGTWRFDIRLRADDGGEDESVFFVV